MRQDKSRNFYILKGEIIVNQVLILTKNILVEQKIQKKLQALNYEVFCSTKVLENIEHQIEALNFFSFIILSETLSEKEVVRLIPLLSKYSSRIIRKVETKVTDIDHKYFQEEILNAIISNGDSIDELRECLYLLRMQSGRNHQQCDYQNTIRFSDNVSLIHSNLLDESTSMPKANYQFLEALHKLSPIESEIMTILIQADGGVVTRESLCHQIWSEEITKSNLASLSSTITRIKNKFEKTDLSHNAIHTLWGKGYRINSELLDHIKRDDTLAAVVSTINK